MAIFLGLLAQGGTPRIFGDGRQTRDYVYVSESPSRRSPRSATGWSVQRGYRETSVLELYDVCRRVAGVDVEPSFEPPRAGELQRSFLDPALAEQELGFRAEVGLDDGMRSTWEGVEATQSSDSSS